MFNSGYSVLAAMKSSNPFEYVRSSIANVIALEMGIPTDIVVKGFEIPREEYGDLALVLPKVGLRAEQAFAVASAVMKSEFVEDVKPVGIYVNITLNRERFVDILFQSLVSQGESYGIYREEKPKRIVVEFVSANPLHPLHIGAARNAALGQFVANILKVCGNTVQTRFYINDVGRQVALLVLGARLLPEIEPPPGIKPDHWIGLLYATTNTVVEVYSLREKLEEAKSDEEKTEIQRELDELLVDLARLRKQAPELVDTIAEKMKGLDIDREVSEIMRKYEAQDQEIVSLVRRVVGLCIEGFRQTLKRFGVEIDVWDWESDLVWEGEVDKIISELEKSPLTVIHKGATAVDLGRLAEDDEIREKLAIDRDLEIPPLIFRRSDGTTLYTVRDIAYTLKKFREFQADKVINVIASEQTLPQAQLKLALYLLGYTREAENLVHYSYEIVTMEGAKMSSRRGRLIALDDILDMAKSKALAELEARGSRSEELAEKIGVAAVKFYLLHASPSKPIKFSWRLALDFEKNSAPYLLYTYARTEGIFRKAREQGLELDLNTLLSRADKRFARGSIKRWRIARLVGGFSDAVYNTYVNLDPSILVVYSLRLADEFNSWYNEESILLEEDDAVRASKMLLTYGVRVSIGNALRILGIEPLERL